MPRANIDLSWLASLLTKTPTATPNDTFGATQEAPYTDPLTGNTSSEAAYQDAKGNEIPGSVTGKDTTHPFVQPTNWQRLVHQDASNSIDQLNNQYTSRPTIAQQVQDVTNKLGGQNFDTMRPLMPKPLQGVSPVQGYLATGGDYQPTHALSEGTALIGNENDQPELNASAAHNTAQQIIEEAASKARAAHRANIIGNPEKQADVSGLGLDYQAGEYRGEMGVQPLKFQNIGLGLQNDITQNQGLASRLPYMNASQLADAQLMDKLSAKKMSLAPQYERSLGNQAISDEVTSGRIPLQPQFSNIINPTTGMINTRAVDPYGIGKYQLMGAEMQGIDSLSGGKPFVIKDANGTPFTVPNNGLDSKTIDPSTGQSTRKPQATRPTDTGMTNAPANNIPQIPGLNRPRDYKAEMQQHQTEDEKNTHINAAKALFQFLNDPAMKQKFGEDEYSKSYDMLTQILSKMTPEEQQKAGIPIDQGPELPQQ